MIHKESFDILHQLEFCIWNFKRIENWTRLYVLKASRCKVKPKVKTKKELTHYFPHLLTWELPLAESLVQNSKIEDRLNLTWKNNMLPSQLAPIQIFMIWPNIDVRDSILCQNFSPSNPSAWDSYTIHIAGVIPWTRYSSLLQLFGVIRYMIICTNLALTPTVFLRKVALI